jgi:hypothetical protein
MPLEWILEAGDAEVVMTPAPLRPGHVVLTRVAEERGLGGGLAWPDPPSAWEEFRGRAVRQRLAEVEVGPADRDLRRGGRIASLTGFSGWPVAAVIGACALAIGAETPRT